MTAIGWTIYSEPRDYPKGTFVARQWFTIGERVVPTCQAYSAPTLDGVRARLPPGLVCLHRMPEDDPCIVEVWI